MIPWLLLGFLAGCTNNKAVSVVTVEEGTNFSIAVSPESGEFILDVQGVLWLLPASGGTATAVTDPLDDSRLPDWSPNYRRIAFQSFRTGSWDIWAINPDGSNLEQLTKGTADEREPVWSPDGTHIAFSSDRSGDSDIWLLDIENGNTKRLTENAGNDYMPTWSPDGRTIAFVSERSQWGQRELWKIDVASGNESRISVFEDVMAYPSWAPDGRSIAFRLTKNRILGSARGWPQPIPIEIDLAEIDLATGTVRHLTRGSDVFPARPIWGHSAKLFYTADGKIKYVSPSRATVDQLSDNGLQHVPFRLSLPVDRPDYDRRQLSIPKAGQRFPVRGIVRPSVSPDGKKVLFTALGDIWTMALDTGEAVPVRCTADGFRDSNPTWSPDGKEIVFASDRAGTMNLWVIAAEECPADGAHKLTDESGLESTPAWSPDGQKIAYVNEKNQLVVVDADSGSELFAHVSLRSPAMPSWSSNSRHIALADFEQTDPRFYDGMNRLLIIDTESGETAVLDIPNRSFGVRDGDGPVWSPDGRILAFGMGGGIWLLPVTKEGKPDGGMKMVSDEAGDFLSWFPDSKRLLYIAPDGMNELDLADGQSRLIGQSLEYRIPPRPEERLLIRNIRLIDGTGAPPREHVDVLVSGDRIDSIEPAGTAVPVDVSIIDGSGRTLIPGLIEGHTHLAVPAWGNRESRIWLAYGITTVRVLSGPTQRLLEEKETINAGLRLGPRIFYSGFMFDGDRIFWPSALSILDRDELKRELERGIDYQYDLFKTYIRLPNAFQKTIVEEAHRNGIFVTSHDLYPATAYGVDGIEHLSAPTKTGTSSRLSDLGRVYEDGVALIVESGAYLTPTMQVLGGYETAIANNPQMLDDSRFKKLVPYWAAQASFAFRDSADATRLAEWNRIMQAKFDSVGRLHDQGARIISGSDSSAGLPFGISLLFEIYLMSEAGLGPIDAINSATGLAAEAIGIDEDLGTIEPGKIADMAIINGNPANDIRSLFNTELVIVGGRVLDIDQLLQD